MSTESDWTWDPKWARWIRIRKGFAKAEVRQCPDGCWAWFAARGGDCVDGFADSFAAATGAAEAAVRSFVTQRVLDEILDERGRQHEKWGEQNHPSFGGGVDWSRVGGDLETEARASLVAGLVGGGPSWAAVLTEEVGEALREPDPEKLRAELVQIAAVAVAWIESMDRNKKET